MNESSSSSSAIPFIVASDARSNEKLVGSVTAVAMTVVLSLSVSVSPSESEPGFITAPVTCLLTPPAGDHCSVLPVGL